MNRVLTFLPQACLGAALFVPLLALQSPAAAQTAEDWNSAPLAIPSTPATTPSTGSGTASETPPPRPILQPPDELRRPQGPLLPGQQLPAGSGIPAVGPPIRIAPGSGVRPIPRPAAAPAVSPAVRAPARGAPALRVPVAPAAPASPGLEPSTSRRVAPRGPSPAPRPSVPSLLEMLPPGTIRPLPGEILPGSGERPSPSPLQGMPAPPPPPQAVPPPPWADRKPQGEREAIPWIWLLLGLGIGGTAMFLLQERRPQAPVEGPLDALGIRIVARPDPGVQNLRPVPRPVVDPSGAESAP
jgi:hypothetical protein